MRDDKGIANAQVYIEKWVEWVKDGIPPAFGLMGMARPADDPCPGLWPVIQVEWSIKSQQEYHAVYGMYVLRMPLRPLAGKLDVPKSTLHLWHRNWLRRLAAQIDKRPPETVVEAEIMRWRSGQDDGICDWAVRSAAFLTEKRGTCPGSKRKKIAKILVPA